MPRKNARIVRSAVGLALASASGAALGQSAGPVPYRLLAGSMLTYERCLPPCLCPPSPPVVTPMAGAYFLDYVAPGPPFDIYSVNDVEWATISPTTPQVLTGDGVYRLSTGPIPAVQQMQLKLKVGEAGTFVFESGLVAVTAQFPRIEVTAPTAIIACQRWTVKIVAEPISPTLCYADCSGDGSLDVRDFVCFQNRFALGDLRADCTADGLLDVRDFTCFQNQFALGCP